MTCSGYMTRTLSIPFLGLGCVEAFPRAVTASRTLQTPRAALRGRFAVLSYLQGRRRRRLQLV